MPTHYVSFAGQNLAIEYHPKSQELIDFLYKDTASEPVGSPDATLTIEFDGEDYVLQDGPHRVYKGESASLLATLLIRKSIYHLINKNKDGMALHAAAVSKNGNGIILPGRSGSGKTSMSTWLTTRGFNYLTDEYVFIRNNSSTIDAFTRPPNVKTKGLPVLDQYFDLGKHEDETLRSYYVAMIPPKLLNPNSRHEAAEVKLIVFPKYKKNSELVLTELSKAQAGLSLMENLVNARNLDGHGFYESTRLARSVPAYKLIYGSFDQIGEFFENAFPG